MTGEIGRSGRLDCGAARWLRHGGRAGPLCRAERVTESAGAGGVPITRLVAVNGQWRAYLASCLIGA